MVLKPGGAIRIGARQVQTFRIRLWFVTCRLSSASQNSEGKPRRWAEAIPSRILVTPVSCQWVTPTVNQYRSYRCLCYGIVNDVAGRGDNVSMRWMKRADYRTMLSLGTDPEMLRHTGDRRMKTLDPKIAALS